MGIAGEILTERLVEPLLRIPVAEFLRMLVFPGSLSASSDHVVLCADRLSISHSKLRRNEDDWLTPSQPFAAPNKMSLVTKTSFPAAVDGYHQRFLKLQVSGQYVIHSHEV